MQKIVAIGGSKDATPLNKINKYIVYLAQKQNPNFLFIPTASNDNPQYIDRIQAQFEPFNVNFNSLNLCTQQYSREQIRTMINNADIIYVGGGNTKMMMELWKKLHVDTMLLEAYQDGKVCCGLSAGAICWFKWGHSDSNSFTAEKGSPWDFIAVEGLGCVDSAVCVHYDEPGRNGFDNMLNEIDNVNYGIALENNNAVVILDQQAFPYSEDDQINVYLFEHQDKKQYTKKLWEKDNNIVLAKAA